MEDIARAARHASTVLKTVKGTQRQDALRLIREQLLAGKDDILAANARDLDEAKQLLAQGSLSTSLLKRLDLSKPNKYDDMLQGIQDVMRLEDPVGKETLARKIDHDLELRRISCPVGVLLIIFEARPEVVANITALAIKSGNAVILKGGKESSNSIQAISKAISTALAKTEIPAKAVQIVSTRHDVAGLLSQDKYIDMVIPRGSNALVRNIKENTKIPVLGHADGLCTIYLHSDAPVDIARKVVVDSKTDYPAACNAVETLLVHKSVLETSFPIVARALSDLHVELRCDDQCFAALSSLSLPNVVHADDTDFDTEYLDLVLAVRSVADEEEAILHINQHGSGHTDCIITSSKDAAHRFMDGVDAAGTYWNCSTRFADGFRYGFGAEVGISTNKVHARGPVGLEGLMIYQYQLCGNGNTAAEYSNGVRHFLHSDI